MHTLLPIAKRALIVAGVLFVMFLLMLLTSNKLYALGHVVPFEVIYSGVAIGLVGCVLYLLNRTPFRYAVFCPPVLLLILYLLR